ncbi:MAG: hypothetical protein LBT41_04625 [Candidatus Methanoplasma sp.]|jgi:hypothetical protein|nr:hypothetical protein [Candidatus Methanoplasma sp.]
MTDWTQDAKKWVEGETVFNETKDFRNAIVKKAEGSFMVGLYVYKYGKEIDESTKIGSKQETYESLDEAKKAATDFVMNGAGFDYDADSSSFPFTLIVSSTDCIRKATIPDPSDFGKYNTEYLVLIAKFDPELKSLNWAIPFWGDQKRFKDKREAIKAATDFAQHGIVFVGGKPE